MVIIVPARYLQLVYALVKLGLEGFLMREVFGGCSPVYSELERDGSFLEGVSDYEPRPALASVLVLNGVLEFQRRFKGVDAAAAEPYPEGVVCGLSVYREIVCHNAKVRSPPLKTSRVPSVSCYIFRLVIILFEKQFLPVYPCHRKLRHAPFGVLPAFAEKDGVTFQQGFNVLAHIVGV